MGMKVREYIRREHIRPVLRFLIRIVLVVGVILIFDVIGVLVFLLCSGQWNLLSFIELLQIVLLAEGALIGAAGAFLFFGYSEFMIARQAAINPAVARDQVQRWRERRLSQQKWGIAMLIAGVLLIFLFLLLGFLTSL